MFYFKAALSSCPEALVATIFKLAGRLWEAAGCVEPLGILVIVHPW
jgi:hypothetical protein